MTDKTLTDYTIEQSGNRLTITMPYKNFLDSFALGLFSMATGLVLLAFFSIYPDLSLINLILGKGLTMANILLSILFLYLIIQGMIIIVHAACYRFIFDNNENVFYVYKRALGDFHLIEEYDYASIKDIFIKKSVINKPGSFVRGFLVTVKTETHETHVYQDTDGIFINSIYQKIKNFIRL